MILANPKMIPNELSEDELGLLTVLIMGCLWGLQASMTLLLCSCLCAKCWRCLKHSNLNPTRNDNNNNQNHDEEFEMVDVPRSIDIESGSNINSNENPASNDMEY